MTRPLVVIGASAAGLLAGIFAGRSGTPALVLETRPKPGAKIRVSGGGRCNLLPSQADLSDFHTSGSSRSLRNILFSWPLPRVRSFFEEELQIPLKREATGKLFPVSERPLDVVNALLREVERTGGTVRTNARVAAIERDGDGFLLQLSGGHTIRAERVVLATGGLSLPKTGSDGSGYAFARAFGHELTATFPVLVPLTTADPRWLDLPGVTLPASLRVRSGDRVLAERHGSFLFTHRGFSGPVVLDVSRALTGPADGAISLEAGWGEAPLDWPSRLRTPGPGSVGSITRDALPRRLANLLLDLAGVQPGARLAEISRTDRQALERVLTACRLPVQGNEGYRIAEATGGGVSLDELHTKTLESRKTPGLHFAGEVLDVDGRIGGFNFLWAFVSGRRAGEAAALRTARTNG